MAVRAKDSEISKTEYDVFLSFRGPDTRQGFTNVLYNQLKESRIQMFMDDDELEIGDKIELILEAIKNSKICVPIFSKTFASSPWCLREVAKMVELNKEIVPIFYDVTPDDVKLKTPLYVDQMKKYGRGQGEEWEKALMEIGRIKGSELQKNGFVEFSKKFGAEIALKLRVQQKYTIKHFVEMPDEVEEAIKLLEIGSVGVRFLGMYGMGGAGKTTLAKIIFDQISNSFDSCSFLTNIREERSHNGLESLRTKLLQDLHPKGDSKNMNFRLKSVLIVLDDVGERSHIDELVGDSISFGPRSRIIITTRDRRTLLMNVAEASSSGDSKAKMSTSYITNMEVKGMNPKQAMQLFCRHSFGRDYPLEDYESLSKDAILISGGLPLALEVIGSLLYGMSVEAWKDKVTILKTIPAEDVREKLMISYNTLEDNVKEIFLDIACFFIHADKANPIYMWEACDFGPNWALEILVCMSLIKITDDDKFWMHDQLRDMGREIVRIKGNNTSTCREGSRIQTYEDVSSLHGKNKEKEVVGLRLHGVDDNLTDFSNFVCLRFLQVLGHATVHHTEFWQLSTNLRWLCLMLDKPNLTAPIRSMFSSVSRNRNSSYLMKLAVLDLSESAITDIWDGWILIQELRRLKVLNLFGCENLSRTPNFSKMESLEKLLFGRCVRLTKVDRSIGKLQKLKYLNFGFCKKLKELPEEIGNMEDVEQIIMDFTGVSKLPDSIGRLKNLWNLSLYCVTRLKKLPSNIGLLVKLKHLKLSSPVINELPSSIGDLISLVNLDLSGCHMVKELPSSITKLKKLERLNLDRCIRLVKLPNDLGNMDLLVELNLSSTGVVVVPESIGDLTRLQVINLSWTPLSVLPGTIAQLSFLQKLDIYRCSHIETIPELPTSLTDLKLNVRSLKQGPSLSKLDQLRELTLDDGKLPANLNYRESKYRFDRELSIRSLAEKAAFKFDAPDMLLRLEILDLDLQGHFFLPVELSALARLKSLKLSCSNLMCIPLFPSSLQSLTLRNLGGETKMLCLSNLDNLSELQFESCSMEGGIYDLGVDRLESLIRLSVYDCPNINKFPDLSRLKRLEELDFSFCDELVEIPGLSTLVSLKVLWIFFCGSLKRLENIQHLTSLRRIFISVCRKLRVIEGLEKLAVPNVDISSCKCKDNFRWERSGQNVGSISQNSLNCTHNDR